MHHLKYSLILLVVFLFFPLPVSAIVDPLTTPNNQYGIHIISESDLPKAQELVNSSGGDWGYITVVIREDERDLQRWQQAFDDMRRRHLIPIVRLATTQENDGWKRFEDGSLTHWVYFLNSLNWVTKNRYVVIGNEPNHAKEWGGEVNPTQYANTLCDFYHNLKAASDDFFVLPAGLDASAPNDKEHSSEERFLKEMVLSRPDIFSCLDGWTSHSYPNPAFSGSENAQGRGSVRTFQWELAYLKSLGLTKSLPVFITETGWAHNQNQKTGQLLDTSLIGAKFTTAFQNAWNSQQVVAITPFLLNYQTPPFNQFSWVDQNNQFYPFAETVKAQPKTKGHPKQDNLGEIAHLILPKIAFSGSSVNGMVYLKNKGQTIWEISGVTFRVSFTLDKETVSYLSKSLQPGEGTWVSVRVLLPDLTGNLSGRVKMTVDNQEIGNQYLFSIYTFTPQIKPSNYLIKIKKAIEGWLAQRRQFWYNSHTGP